MHCKGSKLFSVTVAAPVLAPLLAVLFAALVAFPIQSFAQTPISSCELLVSPKRFLNRQIEVSVQLTYKPATGWVIGHTQCRLRKQSHEPIDLFIETTADSSAIGGPKRLSELLRLMPPRDGTLHCSDCPAYAIRRLRLVGTLRERNLEGIEGPVPRFYLSLERAISVEARKLKPPA
jgi:hypothetical protein